MKEKLRKVVSVIFVAIFSFSIAINADTVKVMAETTKQESTLKQTMFKKSTKTMSQEDMKNKIEKKFGKADNSKADDNLPAKKDPNETVRVIVQLKDKPALAASNKKTVLKASSKSSYEKTLKSKQQVVESQAQKLPGAKIKENFTELLNGFSMDVKRSQIDKLKKINGVKKVTEANKYTPDMTYAKSLTQIYDEWKNYGYKGQGMVVAVVDSGVAYDHKDMKITDASKDKLNQNNVLDGKDDPGKFFTDKVPYGYNFADSNQDIIDRNPQTGGHGAHVAGIISANASDDEVKNNTGIQGVAPEAQVLALKVFTNDPTNKYAYSDTIVKAIESAVEHKADVINMSLGDTAGFKDDNDPEEQAVQNAVAQGTAVVISAGNAYYSTYPNNLESYGYDVPDTGLIGAPGISDSAITVSSYENTKTTFLAFKYSTGSTTGTVAYQTSEVSPEGVLTGKYSLVDCGKGQTSDFDGKDLSGKIALIQRGGGLSFVDKKKNAQSDGAVGAIIYNNDGDDSYVSMVTDSSVTIPAIFVNNTDGKTLESLISSNVQVSFEGLTKATSNVNASQMSDFSSYGPSYDLNFKPDVAAPGGNIYSTVNNNKYETMSGTSMAAPHTSGATALLLQAIKKEGLSLTKADLVKFAKNDLINTAKPEMDQNGVPYSPRREGAGLIQVNDAVKNSVSATGNDGSAEIALKEISGKSASFNINVKNSGTSSATYNLSNLGGVLTQAKDEDAKKMLYDRQISGASVSFDSSSVTVAPGETKTVKVTVSLPDSFESQQFVEGYIKLGSTDSNVPSLNVPFMGFYGDWTEAPILDAPMWSQSSIYGITTELSEDSKGNLNYLGYQGKDSNNNPVVYSNAIAISPNGDGEYDNAIPYLYLLRNAKSVDVKIKDAKGNVVKDIAELDDVKKDVYNSESEDGNLGQYDISTKWDGTLDNGSTAPEGQYYMAVDSQLDFADANGSYPKPQETLIPVKVDVTAPDIAITSLTSVHRPDYKLTWKASDNLSGVRAYDVFNGDTELTNPIIDNGDGTYSTALNLQKGDNTFTVAVLDNAENMSTKNITVNYDPVSASFDNLKDGMKVNTPSLNITGKLNYAVDKLLVNGNEVTVNKDLTFKAPVTLDKTKVANSVTVEADDTDKTVLFKNSYTVYLDTTAPEIDIASPLISSDGNVHTTSNTVTVSGNVSDDTFGYTFYLNGEKKFENILDTPGGKIANDKIFYYDVSVTDGSKIEVKAVDAVGNTTVKDFNVVVEKNIPVIKVGNVNDGAYYNSDVTPNLSVDKGSFTAELDGAAYTPGTPITSEGKHTLKVNAVNLIGTSNAVVTFTIDKTAPSLKLAGITDGTYYNTDVIPSYSVSDTNMGTVTAVLDGNAYDGKPITSEGKHTLVYTAQDLAGNKTQQTVNFVVDKTAPVVTVTGAQDGNYYNTDVTLSVSVNDANKGSVTQVLDGNAYDGKAVSSAGNHTFTVTALDLAGNKTVKTVNFTIDKTAPVVTITGINDGATYTSAVNPVINVDDKDAAVTSLLDGTVYSGKSVAGAGRHSLEVTAVDKAGNKTVKTVVFTIKPVLTNNPSSVSDTTQAITQSSQAETSVDSSTNIIPAQMFTNLKGTGKNVTFNYGGVSWTIDTDKINPANIKDIDLSVSSVSPNASALEKIDPNSQVISFANNGMLPAPATIRIKVDTSKIDITKPIYVYYYNPETKTTEILNAGNALTVDSDGCVEFTIVHCSDYFLSNKTNAAVTASTKKLVQTGSAIDTESMIAAGTLLILIGAAIVIAKKKKRETI